MAFQKPSSTKSNADNKKLAFKEGNMDNTNKLVENSPNPMPVHDAASANKKQAKPAVKKGK